MNKFFFVDKNGEGKDSFLKGEFKVLDESELSENLLKCCGSANWVKAMSDNFPKEKEKLFENAEKIWFDLKESDWLEAFTHHPKIGDLASLEKKFGSTKDFTTNEQSSVNQASMETLKELAEYNDKYEKKFGFIFIVCATGKTADEMLALIKNRINNDYQTELKIAMGEQNKITKLRLEKLF
ncbi:MAG: 2-oxo-4-hydroxy-4-carboxy-5-ureidoimidazoline decarboxylase [Bacteroidetes bacterium]|nr:2-oxo-4-hydroxy-4-carboxy-5-ureidoimidazoline decarboxylase [Bacteroidota bacterium]